MSYELKKEEEDPNNPVIPGSGQGSLVTGSGGGENSGLASGATPSAGQPFTNVSSYLDANKTQAEGLAGKIAGNIKTQGDTVRGQINQAGQDFTKAAEDKTVKLNQGLVDDAKNNSVTFVQNKVNVDNFGKQRDATYTGPKDLTDYNYSGLQQSAKNAIQRGALVDTDSGREQLLAEVSRRPTAGQNALNNLLLTGQPGAMQTLQGAKTGVSDLSSYLDSINASAIEKGKLAESTTAATKKAIQDQFRGEGGVLPGLYSGVDNRVLQMQREAAELNKGKDLFSQGNIAGLSQAQMNAMGVGREELDSFQNNLSRLKQLGGNFDVTNYIKTLAPEAQISRNNAITSDEAARLQALESLFNGQSQIPLDLAQNQKATSDLIDFDKKAYTDLTSMLRNAETERAAKDMAGWYYETIGQHTGEGYGPARNGREAPDLVRALLQSGRGLNDDEMSRYFNNYASAQASNNPQFDSNDRINTSMMEKYIQQFNDQLQAARNRLGQAQVKQPAQNIALR